jgi:hypothetical protein
MIRLQGSIDKDLIWRRLIPKLIRRIAKTNKKIWIKSNYLVVITQSSIYQSPIGAKAQFQGETETIWS